MTEIPRATLSAVCFFEESFPNSAVIDQPKMACRIVVSWRPRSVKRALRIAIPPLLRKRRAGAR
jgi:hypothetical protein